MATLPSPSPQDEATFYTIADAGYFPGAVGLLNSLRLTGHSQSLVVLDCGLTPRQRELLAPHCRLFPRDRTSITNPTLLKPFPHLLEPDGIAVLIDSDIVVCGSLEPVLTRARQGAICGVADPEPDRWFAEWEQLFSLAAAPRRQPYVNAGLVAFSVRHHPQLLGRWWSLCERIFSHPTIAEGAADGPSSQADQDALNALLMSEWDPAALAVLPPETSPGPLQMRALTAGVHVQDPRSLASRYRGRPVLALHSLGGRGKPWQHKGWLWLGDNPYPKLLRRLLSRDDVALRMDMADLPLWLRPGLPGAVAMRALDVLNQVLWAARRAASPLAEGRLGRRVRSAIWRRIR